MDTFTTLVRVGFRSEVLDWLFWIRMFNLMSQKLVVSLGSHNVSLQPNKLLGINLQCTSIPSKRKQ